MIVCGGTDQRKEETGADLRIIDIESKIMNTIYVESFENKEMLSGVIIEVGCACEFLNYPKGKKILTIIGIVGIGLLPKTVVLKVDIENKNIISSVEAPGQIDGRGFQAIETGCVAGNYYYALLADEKKVLEFVSNNDTIFLNLCRIDLLAMKEWEILSDRNIEASRFSRLVNLEKYLVYLAGVTRRGGMYDPFNDSNTTQFQIYDLQRNKWRDVKVKADFRLVRVGSTVFFDLRGNLNFFGGIYLENGEECLNDFYSVNLSKKDVQADLDNIDSTVFALEEDYGCIKFKVMFVASRSTLIFCPKILLCL